MVVTEQALNIGLWVFSAIWIVGIVILFIRGKRTEKAYLRHFPPFDGVPLEWYGRPRSKWRWPRTNRPDPVGQAFRTSQSEPALERKRQDLHRQAHHLLFWAFGFPTVVWGAFFLLVAVGFIR